ncbi:TTN [Lepeophtheirus salmonis]|uniref:TTN n=1 Tax=Lepeophtheirus salmonis TaxID=72036 RepID=A0A7R8D132_LEPSM|nr:TTN [Lepeophtheirus salmonis]CAF2991867.1 TTN [Lepeophtheirus salmonis]
MEVKLKKVVAKETVDPTPIIVSNNGKESIVIEEPEEIHMPQKISENDESGTKKESIGESAAPTSGKKVKRIVKRKVIRKVKKVKASSMDDEDEEDITNKKNNTLSPLGHVRVQKVPMSITLTPANDDPISDTSEGYESSDRQEALRKNSLVKIEDRRPTDKIKKRRKKLSPKIRAEFPRVESPDEISSMSNESNMNMNPLEDLSLDDEDLKKESLRSDDTVPASDLTSCAEKVETSTEINKISDISQNTILSSEIETSPKVPEPKPVEEKPKSPETKTVEEKPKALESTPVEEKLKLRKSQKNMNPKLAEEKIKTPEPVEQKPRTPEPVEEKPKTSQPKPIEEKPIVPEPKPVEEKPKTPEPFEEKPKVPEPKPVEEKPKTPEPFEEKPKVPESVEEKPESPEPSPVEEKPQVPEPKSVEEKPKAPEPKPVEEKPKTPEPKLVEEKSDEKKVKSETIDETAIDNQTKKVKKVVKKVKEGSKEVKSEDKTDAEATHETKITAPTPEESDKPDSQGVDTPTNIESLPSTEKNIPPSRGDSNHKGKNHPSEPLVFQSLKVKTEEETKDTLPKQRKQVRFIENENHEIQPEIKIIENDKKVRKITKRVKVNRVDKVKQLRLEKLQTMLINLSHQKEMSSLLDSSMNIPSIPVQMALLSFCEDELNHVSIVNQVITEEASKGSVSYKDIGYKCLITILQNDFNTMDSLASMTLPTILFESEKMNKQLTKITFLNSLSQGSQKRGGSRKKNAFFDALASEIPRQAVYKLFQDISSNSISIHELEPLEIISQIPGLESEEARIPLLSICKSELERHDERTLEVVPVEMLIEGYFQHPEYFSSDNIQSQKLQLGVQKVEPSESQISVEEVSTIKMPKERPQSMRGKVIISDDHLRESHSVTEPPTLTESLSLQTPTYSKNIQRAALLICEKVLTPSTVKEIILDEYGCIPEETHLCTLDIGDKIIAKSLERVPLSTSLSEYCIQPEFFEPNPNESHKAEMSVEVSKVVQVQDFEQDKTCGNDIPPLEIVPQIAIKRTIFPITNLESAQTQIALVSICKDILEELQIDTLDLIDVEKCIVGPYKDKPLIGLTALDKTLEIIPALETLRDFYVSPTYFETESLEKQKQRIKESIVSENNYVSICEYLDSVHKMTDIDNHKETLQSGPSYFSDEYDTANNFLPTADLSISQLQSAIQDIFQNINQTSNVLSLPLKYESLLRQEPHVLDEIICQEMLSIKRIPKDIGFKVLVHTLEHVPLQNITSTFFESPEYFISQHELQKQYSYLLFNCSANRRQILPLEEACPYAPQGFLKCVASIIQDVSEGKIINDIVTTFESGKYFELEKIESQMALLSIAESLLAPSTVREIITEELELSGTKALPSIGLRPFVQAIEEISLDVKSVTPLINSTCFEKESVKEKFAIVQSLALELSSQGCEEKTAMEDLPKQSVQNAIANIHKCVKQGQMVSEVVDEIASLEVDCHLNQEKQFGLLKTALRIADAPLIQELLTHEKTKTLESSASSQNLGVKIWLKVSDFNDSFSFIESQKQYAPLLDFADTFYTAKGEETVGELPKATLKSKTKKAILSLSDSIKEGTPTYQVFTIYNPKQYPELSTPQSQCCLLTHAAKINNAACYKEVTSYLNQNEKLPKVLSLIGTRALISAFEDSTVCQQNTVPCFDALNYSDKKARATISRIMKEATLVSEAKLSDSKDALEANTFTTTPPSEISALVSYQDDIKHGKSVKEVFEMINPDFFPSISKIESQMAILSTVERLSVVPIIEEIIVQELPGPNNFSNNLLKTLGTKALLSIVDKTPRDVKEILSFVRPEDLAPNSVKAKIAQVLNIATESNIAQEETSKVVNQKYKGPMKAIADIALRLEHGASVEEVNAAFEAHEFPELENIGSQMAMIKVVERVGQSALIHQVLLQEKASEVENVDKNRKLSSQIGFKALMSTLIHEPYKTEEVITSFNPKDFSKEDVALEEYAKLVHNSKELEIAQASEISTEIKEFIDADVKRASSSEVKSELVTTDTVSSKSSTTKVTTVQSGEAVQMSSSVTDVTKLSIKEGDVFFALATFVSDTGEAMNLVEGEKVHVLEWNNNDWWYVRKHITEESGWVPAQYLKDEQTYTRYVHKKLVEKIEKLPVFEQPKAGEDTFAPKIITKVKTMSAIDGCQVVFTCQIEGSPRPQITWFRQTAIIKPSQDFQISYADDNVATLVIKEVFPEDAGTFTCVAKNCVGYASSSADLMVERPLSDHGGAEKHDRRSLSRESSLADIVEGIPPTFAQRPQTKNAEEGSNTELECRFVAIPEAEVRWFHNKVELKDSERLTIHHQADMHMYCSIIKITETRKGDAGTYEVFAKNREGEASNTLILNVIAKTISQQPPMIVKSLTPTICKIGDSIKMEAVITGKPKPILSWLHNGAPLNTNDSNIKLTDKENIYCLTISNVNQSHDGDYLIKAENEFGLAQTQANLCVQGQQISFVRPLEDVEIKECTNYEMSLEISDENANITWQKDGQEIKEDEADYKFKKDGRKRSLIINSSTVHHEGEYVASVGDQECSCELTVIELPPEFVKSLNPCNLKSGETGVFEIELSKGDAVTRWFKHGLEIEFNHRIQLIIDGKKQRLEIHNADIKDAGEYSVIVGEKSCTALLFVEEPKVSFVGKLKKVTTGAVGQSVKLTVKLSKDDVNVKWLKDGQEISDGPHYSFETDGTMKTLIINDATLSDVASYTCVAECISTITDVELSGGDQKLTIKDEEISNSQEIISTRGQDITLNVPFVETCQKPQVMWLFQGQEISQSEKIQIKITRKSVSITIKHAQSIDCGVYTAKLSNSVSETSVDFVVRIKDKPTPPRGPAMVEWKSDDFMELRWNIPESDGGSAILEYIVERKEESLGKNVSYNFRIIARNEVGLSDAFIVEETFTATSSSIGGSKKCLPGSPNVQVTDVTSKSVTLQWSPPLHNGGAELIEYVLEKKISTSHSWERAATVDPSVTLFTVENLKERCQYYFRISAVNEVGAGEPTSTEIVSLRTHARPPSSPTSPLEIHSVGPTTIIVEWGAPESDGGAPLEGYRKVAVRDAKRHMWMEVGRVKADTQKLKVQDLAEGHQYFIRIFAKNEVGFSDPLENEEAVKVVRPADYKEEEPVEKDKMDDTPSLSFSTTETLSSWMRESHMDADIQSYTTSSTLRRDEYFFRIWYYAKKLFK